MIRLSDFIRSRTLVRESSTSSTSSSFSSKSDKITKENIKGASDSFLVPYHDLAASLSIGKEHWNDATDDPSFSFQISQNDNKFLPSSASPSNDQASATATPDSSINASWLRDIILQHLQISESQGYEMHVLSSDELISTVSGMLTGKSSDDDLQGELLDLLGIGNPGSFDLIAQLLSNRSAFVKSITSTPPRVSASASASASYDMDISEFMLSEEEQAEYARLLQQNAKSSKKGMKITSDPVRQEPKNQPTKKPKTNDIYSGNVGPLKMPIEGATLVSGPGMTQTNISLPSGTTRKWHVHTPILVPDKKEQQRQEERKQKDSKNSRGGNNKKDEQEQVIPIRYEIVKVPPPEKKKIHDEIVLVSVKKGLSPTAQKAFTGIENLNRLQSSVYESAYKSNHNLLICAPTGAGKTNIAMLTITRAIEQHINVNADGKVVSDELDMMKIIYVAPLKALAQEVVETFSRRLSNLKIRVRELTGDMQLTRKEVDETHIIVTTPEKWDVITRKTGDEALVEKVCLLIIDEVHLLGEDRGPVIESLVARTLRLVEQKQKMIRIVGLSATLPNYQDVATFLRVDPRHGMFFFDNSFRPVPLEQTFIGVLQKEQNKKQFTMNELAYEHALDSIRRGNQVMIFVHSRKDTVNTARAILACAQQKKTDHLLIPFKGETTPRATAVSGGNASASTPSTEAPRERYMQSVAKSRNEELRELFQHGIGCHHAGMLREDRNLTEKMFVDRAINLLVCTATLAWGVNLPAHTVIIKGTQVYIPEKGGLSELSMQDVFQCFGRAGRPQYDTSGEAVLITDHEQLPRYLGMLNHALPLESKLISALPDALNAEIVAGTVANVQEACDWLSYTFLYIRMLKNPQGYGMAYNEKEYDPMLSKRRMELVVNAARVLDEAKMTRFGATGTTSIKQVKSTVPFGMTHLGRVASHYYISHETVETFNESLSSFMSDAQLLRTLCKAQEFSQVKARDDEMNELTKLGRNFCPIEQSMNDFTSESSSDHKCFILLQAFISRAKVQSFTLASDMIYVAQNIGRIARALFEIVLTNGWASIAAQALKICAAIDQKCWWEPIQSGLRQLAPRYVPMETVGKIEEKMALSTSTYGLSGVLEMDASEIAGFAGNHALGEKAKFAASLVPQLDVYVASVQPITRGVIRLSINVRPRFKWLNAVHATRSQRFWLWVEDEGNEWILHHDSFMIRNDRDFRMMMDSDEDQRIEMMVPIFEPLPSQYFLHVMCDGWLGSEEIIPIRLSGVVSLPHDSTPHTSLLNIKPLPRTALKDPEFIQFYEGRFEYFNPVQSQVFFHAFHTDESMLVGAPTGSGKTIIAELTLLRLFSKIKFLSKFAAKTNAPESNIHFKAVYVAPLKALVYERLHDWKETIGKKLKKNVMELTGDSSASVEDILKADVIITTPEKFDAVTRQWKTRPWVKTVRLLILDEIHLLGEERGAILEVIVSRLRRIGPNVRIVGLSTALANAGDLGNWIGATPQNGLYNFRPAVRPVPMNAHIHGFPGKHYCPRMASMNKPLFQGINNHSPDKPTLVFVASRRQTRLTALDLISFCVASNEPKKFLGHFEGGEEELELIVQAVKDETLRDTLRFGIGLHHAGLDYSDRDIVERLFISGGIKVLICTSTLAWGVNFPAHLVVIKGTEYYDAKTKRYVPYPVTDVLQMMGRAGRPQFDTSAVAMILVHDELKSFYKRFLYEPFPVESHFLDNFKNHLLAEIARGGVHTMSQALDYISWTYLYRRLSINPTFYGITDQSSEGIATYLKDLVEDTVYKLQDCKCVQVDDQSSTEISFFATATGDTCCRLYLSYKTGELFHDYFHESKQKVIASAATVTAKGNKGSASSSKGADMDSILLELLYVASNADEFSELPVRHNEDIMNSELAHILKKEYPGPINYSSPHMKTFLLLVAHLVQLPKEDMPIHDYILDQNTVLDQIVRVVSGMVEVSSNMGHLKMTLYSLRLKQCICESKIWNEKGIHASSASSSAQDDDKYWDSFMSYNSRGDQGKPKIKYEFVIPDREEGSNEETEETRNYGVEIRFTIDDISNQSRSKPSLTQKGSSSSSSISSWSVILGRDGGDGNESALLGITSISIGSSKKQSATISFMVPRKSIELLKDSSNTRYHRLFLMNDSVSGFDQYITIPSDDILYHYNQLLGSSSSLRTGLSSDSVMSLPASVWAASKSR